MQRFNRGVVWALALVGVGSAAGCASSHSASPKGSSQSQLSPAESSPTLSRTTASLEILTEDLASQEVIGGATFSLKLDKNHDGKYDTPEGTFPMPAGKGGVVVELEPGNYQVTETVVPAGYKVSAPLDLYLRPGSFGHLIVNNVHVGEQPEGPPSDKSVADRNGLSL